MLLPMAEITIIAGPDSAHRHHTEMSGGTLTEIKSLFSQEGISVSQYFLPLITSPGSAMAIPNFDAGIHALEHMFAFSAETGSFRVQVVKQMGNAMLGKCIVDVSPYRLSDGVYGFRVSSAIPYDENMLLNAYKASLGVAKDYIRRGNKAPFSTPDECGQYDLHDENAALQIINSAEEGIAHGATVVNMTCINPTVTQSMFVADLRLARPKAEGDHQQRTLVPNASYAISQMLESMTYLGLSDGEPGDILFGTYGCMTGDYVIVANRPLDQVHVAITRALLSLTQLKQSNNELLRTVGSDAEFCLEHTRSASLNIYQQAISAGPIPLGLADLLVLLGNPRISRRYRKVN